MMGFFLVGQRVRRRARVGDASTGVGTASDVVLLHMKAV